MRSLIMRLLQSGDFEIRSSRFSVFKQCFGSLLVTISVGAGLLSLTGCGVEIRDKNRGPAPLNEFVVDTEYSLPPALIQSEQRVLRYDRLVLKKDAKFITNGQNLRLEIKELVSEDGVVTTYSENHVTPIGVDGRSGGNLEIIVGSATGNFQVVMRGEDGGRGLEGAKPNESLRGPKGAHGQNCIVLHPSYSCWQGTNGETGGVGLPGFPGNKGFKGGNSGQLFITVGAKDHFNLLIWKAPGSGGSGGPGGAGGPGGPGGDKGNDTIWPPGSTGRFPGQPVTYAGAEGPQGPQGPTGPSGAEGVPEKVCVLLTGTQPTCETSANSLVNGEAKPVEEVLKLFPAAIKHITPNWR